MKLLNILLDFLLPPRCPLCGQVVARGESLCPGCKEKLPKAPYTRVLPLAGGKSLRVVAPMPYRDEYRHALHRFKFLGKRSLAKPLGQLMAHALPKGIAADGLAFVPLWEKDRAARGYDQSGLLAKEMAACLGLPLVETLQKTRKTQVQHQLSKALRADTGPKSRWPAGGCCWWTISSPRAPPCGPARRRCIRRARRRSPRCARPTQWATGGQNNEKQTIRR